MGFERLTQGLQRHWWLQAALIVALLVSGVGVVALGSRSTPVSVDEALSRFRANHARRPTTTRSTPTQAQAQARARAQAPAPAASRPAPAKSRAITSKGTGVAAPPDGARHRAPAATAPRRTADRPGHSREPRQPPTADRRVPEHGVYLYATAGYEQIDLLGGSRHDYPKQTTITISRTSCGFDTRWDALRERWDLAHECVRGPATIMQRFVSYHEFLGHSDRREFRCEPSAMTYPASERPGTSWRTRCTSEDATVTILTRVVGVERLTVAGTRVETLHLHADLRFGGAIQGRRISERWLDRATGLEIRNVVEVRATTRTHIGPVRYEERYRRDLTSLQPRS